MTRPRTLAAAASLFTILLAGCAVNPRPTFDEASASVKSRTGLETSWMRSEAEEAIVLARVREILKEPLSPRRAAQIALINNRGLQARLEELGIAQANRVAAGLPSNPEIEGFLGWPSTSSATNKIDVSFGLNILDLFVLPARKNLADLELRQAKALAGDAILKVATRAQTEAYELQALEANAVITGLEVEIEAAL
ncbi:MAG TPA: TolC family protein, partial [Vicinamibacteria bacterium]|nr:TolC family protein [Vicinamibacteria bacterium]